MTRLYRHMLLIAPAFPRTFWGMQYSLPLFGKKALMPPLGLITIAAMVPPEYELRLVDLNCESLTERDLAWADMVCFSAMHTQQLSLFETARRCQEADKLVVFGGPFPTACPEECKPYCDVLVLNEAEETWAGFLDDLAGGTVQSVYTNEDKPDVTQTPIPRFDLLNPHDYACMPIQFSRGCPFECEFCDIIIMFGRKTRTKTPQQVLAELEAVYNTGYRGMIFLVDDNFIGNKREVKKLLPELRVWNETHGHPFIYGVQASVDLARDQTLLTQMAACQFKWAFMGLESPSLESLRETHKYQNMNGSLVEAVQTIQRAGIVVWGGFIVGFDSDGEDIFDRQIAFITQAAVPIAHVAILYALPGTPLHARMEQAGRLKPIDYTNTSPERPDMSAGVAVRSEDMRFFYTNIVTRLSRRQLLEGYHKITEAVYTPREYFKRALAALRQLPHPASTMARIRHLCWFGGLALKILHAKGGARKTARPSLAAQLLLFGRLFRQLPAEYKRESAKFAWAVLRQCPDQIPQMLLFIVIGVHYYRFSFEHLLPDVRMQLEALPTSTGSLASTPSQ